MQQYLNVLRRARYEGVQVPDRTGKGRIRIFGTQERFNMAKGYPIVTTRFIPFKPIKAETLWFVEGSTDVRRLNELGAGFWDRWAVTEGHINAYIASGRALPTETKDILRMHIGSIGPMYGAIWNANVGPSGETQLELLVEGLRQRPFSSRHMVTAFDPKVTADETISPQENVLIGNGALVPCHPLFQCFARPPVTEAEKADGKNRLSLQFYMRSQDLPVGTPFNIGCYALLLSMLAQVTDMVPDELIWTCGDAHIYPDQLEKVDIQLRRLPAPLPTLILNPAIKELREFTMDDIHLEGYGHHDPIHYEVAV